MEKQIIIIWKILTKIMILHFLNNKQRNPVVTELFIRDRKLTISIAFIAQSYLKCQKMSG